MSARVRITVRAEERVSAWGDLVMVGRLQVRTRDGWRTIREYDSKSEADAHLERIAARQRRSPSRFWLISRFGDAVRLAAPADGTVLRWHGGTAHEEGWNREDWSYWVEGFRLHAETTTDGRDCDGRHYSHWRGSCSIYDLEARRGFPAWDTEVAHVGQVCARAEGQRDYTAEAAGY